ncbi:thermonuclease family protein [Nostoc sp. KVJ3]|uniref:thermonuclease family protein n=1 Tax=Nostoc sp. KVJ3 TaxID=457945 RepID=UPI002238DFA2|nr:thermonuclease family protein [Nostoc sp. KVJ3]MCW5319010.1 thermonuclease family protein [Nostoc sp. KVJ3]
MEISKLHVGKIYISLFLVAIAVSGCSKSNAEFPAMANSEEWQVIRVSDGDTMVVRQTDGREKKLRLCGIDAPEKAQPLGKESKANLQRLVNEVEGTVSVTEIESDRYGRTVAEVFSSKNGMEKSLNEEQLSSGNAYLYRQYADKCPNKIAFGNAERIAQSKKLGVWRDSSTVPPWEFRKRQRQNTKLSNLDAR